MRVWFEVATIPTWASKRAKKLLAIKESQARQLTAYVLGYANWHELLQQLGKRPASPLDEELSPRQQRGRHAYQTMRILQHYRGVEPPLPGLLARLENSDDTPITIVRRDGKETVRWDVSDGTPPPSYEIPRWLIWPYDLRDAWKPSARFPFSDADASPTSPGPATDPAPR